MEDQPQQSGFRRAMEVLGHMAASYGEICYAIPDSPFGRVAEDLSRRQEREGEREVARFSAWLADIRPADFNGK